MRRPHLLVGLFVAICVLYACDDAAPAAARRPDVAPPPSTLAGLLAEARARYGIPAIAAAVVRSDAVAEMAATGEGDSRTGAPVTVRSRFMLGSLTKPITATLLATLVQDGRLSWQTRVVDVFPELRDSVLPAYRAVTLAQLLEHRAGIAPMDRHLFDGIPSTAGPPAAQRYAYAKWLLRREPAAPPGTRFLYSNAGYAVAGAMAERVTGRPLEALMAARVFAPLGLATAGFDPPEWRYPDEPAGHDTFARRAVTWIPDTYSARDRMLHRAAGNVHMSVADLARFAQMHLRGLRGLPGAPPLLRPETVRRLHAPNGEYAMGWVIEPEGADTISWHNGTDGRSKAYMALRPGRDLGIVVLMNVGGPRAEEAYLFVEREVLRRTRPGG